MSKLKREQYQALLEPMQVELANAARWLQHTGKRLVVVFEGRDTAGKGGAFMHENAAAHLGVAQGEVVVARAQVNLRRAGEVPRYVHSVRAGGGQDLR